MTIDNEAVMADSKPTLGEMITQGLREDVALLTWIAGLNDRELAAAYRKERLIYNDRCAEYVDHGGQYYMPREPKALPFLLEALLQRCES
jgi:hypothetical protein